MLRSVFGLIAISCFCASAQTESSEPQPVALKLESANAFVKDFGSSGSPSDTEDIFGNTGGLSFTWKSDFGAAYDEKVRFTVTAPSDQVQAVIQGNSIRFVSGAFPLSATLSFSSGAGSAKDHAFAGLVIAGCNHNTYIQGSDAYNCTISSVPVEARDGRWLMRLQFEVSTGYVTYNFFLYYSLGGGATPKDSITPYAVLPEPGARISADTTLPVFAAVDYELATKDSGNVSLELVGDPGGAILARSVQLPISKGKGRIGTSGGLAINKSDFLSSIPESVTNLRVRAVLTQADGIKRLTETDLAQYQVFLAPIATLRQSDNDVCLDLRDFDPGYFGYSGNPLPYLRCLELKVNAPVLKPGERMILAITQTETIDFDGRKTQRSKLLYLDDRADGEPLQLTGEFPVSGADVALGVRATFPSGQVFSKNLVHIPLEYIYHSSPISVDSPSFHLKLPVKWRLFSSNATVDRCLIRSNETVFGRVDSEPDCDPVKQFAREYEGIDEFDATFESSFFVPGASLPSSSIRFDYRVTSPFEVKSEGDSVIRSYKFPLNPNAVISAPGVKLQVAANDSAVREATLAALYGPLEYGRVYGPLPAPSGIGASMRSINTPSMNRQQLAFAAGNPVVPWIAVNRYWTFDPPIPKNGSFRSTLTLTFTDADLPSDPNFDSSKLEMIAYNPTTGAVDRIAARFDVASRSLSAEINSLDSIYSLAVFGPFAKKSLAATALTAPARLSVVNLEPGTVALNFTTPSKASLTAASNQALVGTAAELTGAPTVTWALASGPASMAGAHTISLGATGFDFLELAGAAATRAVFPEVQQSGLVSTEFHIVNPTPFPASAALSMFTADGSLIDSVPINLTGSSKTIVLSDSFTKLALPFTGYATLVSGQPVFASASYTSRSAIAGLNAIAPGSMPARMSIPWLGGGSDDATLSLVNTGTSNLTAVITAYAEDGTAVAAQPVSIRLPSGQQFRAAFSDMFKLTGNAALPAGSVVIERVNGEGSAALLVTGILASKLAMLPLDRESQTAMVIPLPDGRIPSTVRISGSSNRASTATVTALSAAGAVLNSQRVTVPGNGRGSAVVSASGTPAYIRVDSTDASFAFAEAVANGLVDTGIIPAQPAPVGSAPSGGGGPSLTVPSDSVDFGSSNLGVPASPDRIVRISNSNRTTSYRVMAISFSSGMFTRVSPALPFTVAAGSFTDLTLRFTPTATGTQAATAILTTDDPSAATLQVRLTGTGTNPPPVTPSLSVPPETVTVASTPTAVRITNSSRTTAYQVTGVTFSNLLFTRVGPALPFRIGPGSFENLLLQFTSTASGTQTGTATITTDDPAASTLRLNLTGAGTVVSTTILSVDKGTFESVGGFPAGGATGYFVNRLTPPGYPATLRSVLVYFPEGELPLGTGVTILSATNPSGVGGQTLSGLNFQRVSSTIGLQEVFSEIAMTPVTITSGDFVVGFSAVNPAGVYPVVLDTGSSSKQRSYLSNDGTTFRLADGSNIGASNFGIRAKVDFGGGGAGSAVLAASASNLALDSTAVNATSPAKSLTITNTGTSSATVTFSVSGSFTVTPSSAILAPNSAVPVSIIFKPTAATPATQTGTLTISAPGVPLITVALAGTVATPGGGGTAVCVAAPSNLVSWYGGEGNGNDQTGSNAGTVQSGTTFASGQVGQAFNFNGSTGFVQLGNPANLRLTSGVTIEAWINPRSVKAQTSGPPMGAIFTKWAQVSADAADSDSYGLWIISNNGTVNLFGALHQVGPREPTIQGGAIPLNAWTHVAMTFDGASGAYRLYVNGQQVASQTASGNLFATNRNVLIGREDSFIGRAFDGLVDEASIFSRALSAAEIQAIVTAGAAGKCKGETPGPGGTGNGCPSSNNIALNGTASQISTDFNGPAALGNNGIINEPNGYGFHTALQPAPWWQVDLGTVSTICEVRMYNRLDGFWDRAKNIRLLLSTDGVSFDTAYVHNGTTWGTGGTPPLAITTEVRNRLARFVRVQLNETQYLHLREVEVYGIRTNGGGLAGPQPAAERSPRRALAKKP